MENYFIFFSFPLPWGREKNRFEFGKNENLILRERVLFNGKVKVENGFRRLEGWRRRGIVCLLKNDRRTRRKPRLLFNPIIINKNPSGYRRDFLYFANCLQLFNYIIRYIIILIIRRTEHTFDFFQYCRWFSCLISLSNCLFFLCFFTFFICV